VHVGDQRPEHARGALLVGDYGRLRHVAAAPDDRILRLMP